MKTNIAPWGNKKQLEIVEIVKAAVRHLNKVMGSSLKILEINFGLTSNREYRSEGLVTTATVIIQNKEKKETLKLLLDEAFFDASFPWNRDKEAGVARAKNEVDVVILRTAYCIWFNRHRIL